MEAETHIPSWSLTIPTWNGYGWMRDKGKFHKPELVCFVNGKVERGGYEGPFDAKELAQWEFWTERVEFSNRDNEMAIDSTVLLTCPFCGGQPQEYTDGDGPMRGHAVRCQTCGARTEVNISKPGAGVKQWQTRCKP